MSRIIQQEKYFFQLLRHTAKDQRIALIKTVSPRQLKALVELFLNIYYLNITVSTPCKNKLKPYKRLILRLISKTISRQSRKRILLQLEGVLPIVIQQILHLL